MKPAGQFMSTAPLLELVSQTLDAGYAEAAVGRDGIAPARWYDRPALAVGCALIGFTVVVGYLHTNRAAPAAATVHAGLVAKVQAAQAAQKQLGAIAERLTSDVNHQRTSALAGTGSLRADLSVDQLLAGAVAVTGPGLVVRLADAPAPAAGQNSGRPGTTPITAAQVLTDRDIRSVVNELWADGAEAVSVNDVRLTPTSAIRFAGQAVLVDFQPITSPYTIRAIGDAEVLDTRFADSPVASRYHTIAAVRGITFSWTGQPRLTLPANSAPSPRYARPAR
ncbi:MAG: DUF881 domain-containing protein [Actinomycetota bacterium]